MEEQRKASVRQPPVKGRIHIDKDSSLLDDPPSGTSFDQTTLLPDIPPTRAPPCCHAPAFHLILSSSLPVQASFHLLIPETINPTDDIRYLCQRCGNCCRWPGDIRVTRKDITRISRFLGQAEHEFIQNFTRLSKSRQALSIIDKPNGECFFLDGDECTIQPVKPAQCSGFPNAWNFPGWREVCEAIPVSATTGNEETGPRKEPSIEGAQS